MDAANSPAITLGSGEEGQDEERRSPPEDQVISESPIMGAPSPMVEQPHSPTPLERLFQGNGSPVPWFGEQIDLFNRELFGVPPLPPWAAADRADADADATAQLLEGIDGLSNWEPTPSIHSHSQRDRLPLTFDKSVGLWYNSNTSAERYQREDDGVYKDIGSVQTSRVREDELEYGWELIRGFIRMSVWMSPAKLGKQVNRLVNSLSFL